MTNIAAADAITDSKPADPVCMSCGSHLAQRWTTSDGPAVLCRECATFNGLGCP